MLADALFDLGANCSGQPEKAIFELLQLIANEVGARRAVVLATERSDLSPMYRRIARLPTTGDDDTTFLDGNPHIDIADLRIEDRPIVLDRASINDQLGEQWWDYFRGEVLVVPIPGQPLRSDLTNKFVDRERVAAAVLLGPMSATSLPDGALLAAAFAMGNWLDALYRSNAYAHCDRVAIDYLADISELSASEFGSRILDALYHTVSYEAGVLYLRDLAPGKDRYLLYAASKGEDRSHRHIFASYWSPGMRGATWGAMNRRRPVCGTKVDVPVVEGKRTNDSALEEILGKEAVHEAWAIVPFVGARGPVAVAHIEGVNKGRGLSRDLWGACEIQGRILGRFIDLWCDAIEGSADLKPDVPLVDALHSQLRRISPQIPSQRKYEHRMQFEVLVKKAFTDLRGVADNTESLRRELSEHTATTQQPDFAFVFDNRQVLVEITRKDNPDDPAPRCKADQLLRYLDILRDARKAGQGFRYLDVLEHELGILVVGGDYPDQLRDSGESRILVMDRARLERFCSLARYSRIESMRRWIREARGGEHYCWFASRC